MLNELNNKYIRSANAYSKRTRKIDREIKELEAKRERMKYPDFWRTFKPLCEVIKKRLGADIIKTYGPFGLCNERSAYFGKGGETVGSICFVSGGDGWALRNENENTKRYAEGTIGAMNGMNYPVIGIDNEKDIDWVMEFVRR